MMHVRARNIYSAFFVLALLTAALPLRAAYPSSNRHAVFNGASYVSVPNAAALNTTLAQNGAVSLDAWINPTSFSNFPTIIGNTWNSGYWFGLSTNGQLRFYPGSGQLYESQGTVPLNTWTHVAVSFSDKDNEIRFYINGALDRVVTGVTQALGTSADDIRIGADRQGANPSYYFTGGLDEVRMWGSDINFAAALGMLYRIPHVYAGGRYGQSLLAAWRFNGDMTDSTGLHNGTAVGTVAFGNGPGSAHYDRICAVFVNDGNTGLDYFSIPSAAGNSFTGSYSIELWVHLSSGGAASSYQTFVSKGSVPFNSFSYWLGVNKQNGRLRFVPNGVWSNALESSDPLPVGQWVHVAATYAYGGNTGTARVYINGVEKGSQGFAGNAPFSQSSLLVAASDMQLPAGQAYALAGRLDELRLWNVARSAADIANAHRLEFTDGVAGLTAAYHFNGDVLDASPAANHGNNFNSVALGLYFRDASDLPSKASLLVASPNGGENWTIGNSHNIAWNATGLGTVTVELSRDGGATYPETLAQGIAASTGVYSWNVTGPTSSTTRVRVRTATQPELSDESNANFDIVSPPPVLNVQPAQLAFTAVQNGVLPAEQNLQLSNTGAGTLFWNLGWNSPWLYASQNSGSGNSGTISIGIQSTVLPPGVYHDTLVFTGNASNTPLTVPISYIVTSFPEITSEPTFLQFAAQTGVNPAVKSVVIRNTGTGILSWTAISDASWMSVSPAAGGADNSITVSVDVTGLSPSTYIGSIVLSGNAYNVPYTIPVQLVVANAELYALSGRVLSGATPLANVRINVAGDASLSVTTGGDGTFSVAGLPSGSYTITPVSSMYAFTPPSYTITGLNASRTDLNFTGIPKSGSAWLHYQAGWNLISLPVDPPDGSIATLLPDANPPKAWRYAPDTGYVEVTDLVFGVGYWMRFSRSDSVLIDGQLRGDLTLNLEASSGGWYLIGSSSGPVDIAAIRQIPSAMLLHVFQYDPGRGYRLPPGNRLQPGRGYYVKLRGDASLGLIAPAFAPPTRTDDDQ